MPKTRIKIPKATAHAVLDEYNHRCAICAADRPHLHHIDGNPSNNVLLNLLPLCPSCHLSDQHNPTAKIDIGILSLFREHKDPTILSPQFEPLYKRLQFVKDLKEPNDLEQKYRRQVFDLVSFVEPLNMGGYYAAEIAYRLSYSLRRSDGGSTLTPIAWTDAQGNYIAAKIFNKDRIVSEVVILAVELIRYQPWSKSPKRSSDN